MNYQELKDKYLNKKFIILYLIIFFILYLFCSFIKFLGQIPILIVLTFFIVYYINNNLGDKYNNLFISNIGQNISTS
jgi:c-di-AMP phosphodiesterase-like protein